MTQSLASRSTDGIWGHPESRRLFLEWGHVATLVATFHGIVAFHLCQKRGTESSCCDPSGSSFLRPCVTAGVVCHLILVAITAQLAPPWGFWVGEVFALESAAARVCQEVGARVSLNVRVQDMDLDRSNVLDNRRVGIVADGLPLFMGAQLGMDTTIFFILKRDGSVRTRCVIVDGASVEAARRRKEATYPELTGRNGRTRFVVLGCEVDGQEFFRSLAKAKARSEPARLRTTARQAWRLRWAVILACSAARVVALSLNAQEAWVLMK